MKSRTRLFAAMAVVAIFAVSAFGQLSAQYRDWAKGPVQFLMNDDDTARWKQIRTDAGAQAFSELFWARRDPTPGTPANEFKTAFDARVKYADDHFAQGRKRGALTDRGRVWIILGAPTRVERSGPATSVQTPGVPDLTARPNDIQASSPKQMWIYEQSRVQLPLGEPIAKVNFVDQYGNGEFLFERGSTNTADLFKRVNQSYVVSPNMTEVPKMAAAQPQTAPTPQAPPTVATPAPAPVAGVIKTETLRTAIDEFRAAKKNPYKPIAVSYTEMVSPAGDYFVPVQLYIPTSAGVTADAVTTFFGVIEDATGTQVAVFEEPAKLATSGSDLYYDKSLILKPGKYRATLGLAGADGKPIVMASSPMDLKEMSKETSGISRLIVARDVHQTDTAAPPGAPYAFGRLKIVPKGDRVLTNKDELTYFLEVTNPGIDDATNLPKLQVKLELVGMSADGKPGRSISAPISDASALPLTGTPGPGQYAIIASIPLGDMKNPLPAGDYTLRIKVFDQVKKESWTTEQSLKMLAAPATPAVSKK